MTTPESRREAAPAAPHPAEARVVRPLQFDADTPQTGGMHRLAAATHLLADSEKLWAGVMLAEPNTASSVHAHGAQETVVYVSSGVGKLRWGKHLENEANLKRGDFLFIPPYVPHQEINPSPDEWCQWIVKLPSGSSEIPP